MPRLSTRNTVYINFFMSGCSGTAIWCATASGW